jgi:FkbM family methyltransferase
VGSWSIEVLRALPGVQLHCFEPDTRSFGALQKKFSGLPNVALHNTALSDHEGAGSLHANLSDTALSSLYDVRDGLARDADAVPVRMQTLDAYCGGKQIRHIDLLKIDVEGHDFAVLKGAGGLLKGGAIDAVQFEYGYALVFARVFLRDFVEYLGGFGYEIYRIKPLKIEKLHYMPDTERFFYSNFLALRTKS